MRSSTSLAETRIPYNASAHGAEAAGAIAMDKPIVEALGGAAWQSTQQTFSHRWKGTDTLTWGNQEQWIRIILMQAWADLAQSLPAIPDHELHRLASIWASTWAEIPTQSRFAALDRLFTVRNPSAVRRFIQAHPDLVDIVVEAHSQVQKHFGPGTRIALEVVRDPDAQDAEQLFAYIQTALPVDEALKRLDQLDEEWFLDQVDLVQDDFNLNLEFV